MGRPVMLGNGSLTVGLNEHGLVHDFYYPYVGLDNLTTSRSVHHKIGVWLDGRFSWVDEPGWDTVVTFESDALVSNICMRNEELGVQLDFQDFVDSEYNMFGRRVTLHNNNSSHREIRLFMHQVFQISRAGRADTALFVPDANYILDYKGRCSLIIYGQHEDGTVYDQFAIGNYGIEGKEGTYRDAEDGELSGSAVEHGGVDSVMRFVCPLAANESSTIDYWIITADSQYTAEKIHDRIKHEKLVLRLMKTRKHWNDWLSTGSNGLHTIDKEYLGMAKKSLMLIKAHTDKRGGIIASCDSSIYNFGRDYYSYVWPRDGAYVMWPLIRLGYTDEPKKFFEFCRDILTPEGYLMHKYQPDRSIGSTWHPLLHGKRKELAIQEDETAIVIYMLSEFYHFSKDRDYVHNMYATLVQPAANFLTTFTDRETKLPHASYDLWEEKFLTSTYTTAVVYQALLVAAEFADEFEYPDDGVRWREAASVIKAKADNFFDSEKGYFIKGFLLQPDGSRTADTTLDISSLYGPLMFGYYTKPEQLRQCAARIEDSLLDQSPSGGLPRYNDDKYFASEPAYKGNPWFVATLWLAQYFIRTNQSKKARHYMNWTLRHALPSGAISEQVNPSDGLPLSVTPLVWSHAEFLNTALDLASLTNQEE